MLTQPRNIAAEMLVVLDRLIEGSAEKAGHVKFVDGRIQLLIRADKAWERHRSKLWTILSRTEWVSVLPTPEKELPSGGFYFRLSDVGRRVITNTSSDKAEGYAHGRTIKIDETPAELVVTELMVEMLSGMHQSSKTRLLDFGIAEPELQRMLERPFTIDSWDLCRFSSLTSTDLQAAIHRVFPGRAAPHAFFHKPYWIWRRAFVRRMRDVLLELRIRLRFVSPSDDAALEKKLTNLGISLRQFFNTERNYVAHWSAFSLQRLTAFLRYDLHRLVTGERLTELSK